MQWCNRCTDRINRWWENTELNAINQATCVGIFIACFAFGVLANRFGRKKLYGYELLIIVIATLSVALTGDVINGMINIGAWIIVWQFVMDIRTGE